MRLGSLAPQQESVACPERVTGEICRSLSFQVNQRRTETLPNAGSLLVTKQKGKRKRERRKKEGREEIREGRRKRGKKKFKFAGFADFAFHCQNILAGVCRHTDGIITERLGQDSSLPGRQEATLSLFGTYFLSCSGKMTLF